MTLGHFLSESRSYIALSLYLSLLSLSPIALSLSLFSVDISRAGYINDRFPKASIEFWDTWPCWPATQVLAGGQPQKG